MAAGGKALKTRRGDCGSHRSTHLAAPKHSLKTTAYEAAIVGDFPRFVRSGMLPPTAVGSVRADSTQVLPFSADKPDRSGLITVRSALLLLSLLYTSYILPLRNR